MRAKKTPLSRNQETEQLVEKKLREKKLGKITGFLTGKYWKALGGRQYARGKALGEGKGSEREENRFFFPE